MSTDKKYFSVFSGAGGIDLGLPKSWQCVGFSEVERCAIDNLKYNYPTVKNYGDISTIKWSEVPDFDLLVGGSPCQDLSIIGRRAGLEGTSSKLFHEYVRALREKQPSYFLWENVEGALNSQGGWDFARIQVDLAESGYALWFHVLNAKHFSTPQERKRIIVIGARGGSLPEIFFEPESNQRNDPEAEEAQPFSKSLVTRAQRQDPTIETLIAHSIMASSGYVSSTQRRKHENYIATTVNTRGGTRGGSKTHTSYNLRRFTPLETERIMGWPDHHTKYGRRENGEVYELSEGKRYFLCGNGVASRMIAGIITKFIQ